MSLLGQIPAWRRGAQALVIIIALAAEASCDDTPHSPPKGPYLFLTPSSASIAVGDSMVFRATATGILASGEFRWTSSNPVIATVSASGVVRGLAPGPSTIAVSTSVRPAFQSAALVTVRAP